LSAKPPLIRGVSIGFRELVDPIFNRETGGFIYPEIEVLELSMVVIPAHQDATINTLKSLDTGRAASGTASAVVRSLPSGVSDTSRVKTRTDGAMKKSYAEQIAAFEATRQAKNAEMDTIMEAAGNEGVTLDQAQQEKYDALDVEVKAIDEHLVRLRAAEERNKKAAKPVDGSTPEKASAARAGQVITVNKTTPPGIEFARYAMCLASAKGNTHQAYEIAKLRYPEETRIHEVIKAAVAAGTTTDATWAGNLVQYQDFAGDFIEYLRPATIIGKFGTGGIPA